MSNSTRAARDVLPVSAYDALIASGLALAHTVDSDGVILELGRQVRRVLSAQEFAIWTLAAETAAPQLAHQTLDEGDTTWADRFATLVTPAMTSGEVRFQQEGKRLIMAAPLAIENRPSGALAVVVDLEGPHHGVDAARGILANLAQQASVALERVRIVRQRTQKQRLEAVGEVAAGVAQELRGPLFGISSAAQLLRFRAQEDVVIEKNVGRILREVDLLGKMVSALLEFGRPRPVTLDVGDPDAVWDDVLKEDKGLLESRALVVQRTRPAQASRVFIDREHLEQVFHNLLENAADHAPSASDLVLESSFTPEAGWRCRLWNGGPGVSPDVVNRAFELFFTTKPGGIGIGLALCQRIVHDHGGSIAMSSAPEQGTTLSIALPAAPG